MISVTLIACLAAGLAVVSTIAYLAACTSGAVAVALWVVRELRYRGEQCRK